MLGALHAIPFLKDRETVMGLLISEPGPVRNADPLPLSIDGGYRFTVEDVRQLIAQKRSDLAELILASTPDTSLLEDVAAQPVTAALARSICKNGHTPVRVLAAFHADPRKGVSQAAVMAMAHRMGMHGKHAAPVVNRVLTVLTCEDAALAGVLRGLLDGPRMFGVEMAAAVAFERSTPVPDDAWEVIQEFVSFINPRSLALVKGLMRDERTTVELIESLMRRCHTALAHQWMLKTLLERRSELDYDRALALLTRYAAHTSSIPQDYLSIVEESSIAGLLANEEDYAAASVAFASGMVPAEVMEELVECWLARADQAVPSAAVFMAGVQGGRLTRSGLAAANLAAVPQRYVDSALAGGRTTLNLARALASNPRLTKEAQEQILSVSHSDPMSPLLRALACNQGIDEDVAQVLVQKVCESYEGISGPSWALMRFSTELFENPGIPARILRRLPTRALVEGGYVHAERVRAIVSFLSYELGQDPHLWREFLTLLPEWEGSIGDLADVLRAL